MADVPDSVTVSSGALDTRIRHLLERCAGAASPRSFVENLVSWLADSYGFDQAIALFYDTTSKIVAFHTLGTREGWLESYLDYYFEYLDMSIDDLEDGPGIERVLAIPPNGPFLRIDAIDWSKRDDSFFKRNYIEAANLKSTLSFNLCDMKNRFRVAICLDRRRSSRETESRELLKETLPTLNGMYQSYYYREADDGSTAVWDGFGLTQREVEIADMLCRGMRAGRIAEALFISRQTANKHIAHIYRKVGVSSQAELIVRLAEHRMLF